jgi:glycosyltransferase involved in cell wall biosynthesis
VDSVLNQEYRDFELFLMDDGSTDGSAALCDAYALRDPRVTVVHKENTGVSDTRNQAIDRATGTYLQFLDSDDWITPDATALLVQAAQTHGCDMVISDFYRVSGERVSHKGDIEEDTVLSREEFASHMMENPADYYYGVLWNKLFRRDIVRDHQLRMDPELRWCEDFMFNLEYIRHAETFYALQVPVYYYVKTKGSLVSQNATLSKMVKMKLMVFEYYDQFYRSVLDEAEYEKNHHKLYRFLIDAAKDGVVLPAPLPGSKKLGKERSSVSPESLSGEGMFLDSYRSRKLLERYLEPVALKYDLPLADALLLLKLSQAGDISTRQALAEFSGLSRRSFHLGLQRLSTRGYLQVEESRPKRDPETGAPAGERQLTLLFSPASESLLEELESAQHRFHQAQLEGFSQEELDQYRDYQRRIRENTQNILK